MERSSNAFLTVSNECESSQKRRKTLVFEALTVHSVLSKGESCSSFVLCNAQAMAFGDGP